MPRRAASSTMRRNRTVLPEPDPAMMTTWRGSSAASKETPAPFFPRSKRWPKGIKRSWLCNKGSDVVSAALDVLSACSGLAVSSDLAAVVRPFASAFSVFFAGCCLLSRRNEGGASPALLKSSAAKSGFALRSHASNWGWFSFSTASSAAKIRRSLSPGLMSLPPRFLELRQQRFRLLTRRKHGTAKNEKVPEF